jgi:transglutaminase-like putative cysteine protease
MENEVIPIDDQPIAASFFGEGRWLTDFITPEASDIQKLFKQLTKGIDNATDRITACWKWVACMVRYVPFVRGKLMINGKSSVQDDFWASPSMTIHTKVGNCATKSFLLTSLLRNELPPDQIYCAMGNLYNGKPGGHAWVALKLPDGEQVMETTIPTAPPMVPVSMAKRYEPVHYFNDISVYAVQGKTQLLPMATCYSTWLSDYLNWAYIEGQRIKLTS